MTRINVRAYSWHVVVLSLCLFSFSAFAQVNDSSVKVSWSYKGNTGPDRWGQLNPAFAICARGKSQSPIDFMTTNLKTPYALTIHYQTAPLEIVEDGFTSLMIGNTKTIVNDGHTVQVNFKTTPSEFISYQGNNYPLVQFHVHSPSEHELHNATFPLEIHFVHQGVNGQLVVLGVFVESGKANPELQKILDHLPKEKGKEQDIVGETINPGNLIPANKDYFSYMGSLTTPPCTEGVQWIVMSGTITASPAQILLLRKETGGGNARSVQPLFKRKVFYSK